MHIASIGIDLGKTTFHLVALGERNKGFGSQEVLPYAAVGLYRQPARIVGWSRGMRNSLSTILIPVSAYSRRDAEPSLRQADAAHEVGKSGVGTDRVPNGISVQ